MDEDADSANWVLVDEIDCAEEATTLNPPVTSVPSTPDSDQESDGSISIISDHPTTDSYSEEETDVPKKNDITPKIMPIIKIDTEFEIDINYEEDDMQVQKPEISEPLQIDKPETPEPQEKCRVEDVAQEVFTSHQTSDDDASSASESSSKQWTFAGDKSKLELDTSKKTFFLDCSQEPILEVSSNDTDLDAESTNSSQESQAVVKKDNSSLESSIESSITSVSNISNRELPRNREMVREFYFNRISMGFLISMLLLTSSHLIKQYLDSCEEGLQSSNPSSSFLDSIADNEKAGPVIDFCVNRLKAKGNDYSEQAVEKCVIKRLRKKNREDAVKKTEIYLQMKERILELREKELAEKEREILKKWRKRTYNDEVDDNNEVEKESKRKKYEKNHGEDKESMLKDSKESNKKFKRNSVYKEGRSHEKNDDFSSEMEQKTLRNDFKNRIKTFRKKGSWVFENVKEASNWNYKMYSKDDQNNQKKHKKAGKDKEEALKSIKDKYKQKYKDLKADRKEDPNEEWYIKYNPVKNTIELINITTLPEQDSALIKNGNKTINGQWYFSLYGSSRSNIRNKEKAAEWYFRRGNFRENKRDKAKWYFDYMSARDNTRYFY